MSNVGLPTPRGSGTSGYVQRNHALLKPRKAPYPPTTKNGDTSSTKKVTPFDQRQPDKQILEHDRRRAIEVKVFEERERLEEENERNQEDGNDDAVISEEEIDHRCDELRDRLSKDMEDETEGFKKPSSSSSSSSAHAKTGGRRQFKSYQVHELAEAKIEESERLRKALGIKEDWEREREWQD